MSNSQVANRRAPRWRRTALVGAILVGAISALVGASVAAAAPTAPPPVTVLTSASRSAPGDVFITPTGDATQYANGPEIIDRQGQVVWFHASGLCP
jgi:hypothetical protein